MFCLRTVTSWAILMIKKVPGRRNIYAELGDRFRYSCWWRDVIGRRNVCAVSGANEKGDEGGPKHARKRVAGNRLNNSGVWGTIGLLFDAKIMGNI